MSLPSCPNCGSRIITQKACHTCGHNFHKGGKGGGGGGAGVGKVGGGNQSILEADKESLSKTRPPDALERMAGIEKPVPVMPYKDVDAIRQSISRREGKYKGLDEDALDDVYWKAHGVIQQQGQNSRAMAKLYKGTQNDYRQAQIQAHDTNERAKYIRRHGDGTEREARDLESRSQEWTKRSIELRDRMTEIRQRVPNVDNLH